MTGDFAKSMPGEPSGKVELRGRPAIMVAKSETYCAGDLDDGLGNVTISNSGGLVKSPWIVTPAKAGVQNFLINWIPAFAGMTEVPSS
jgi:hypothetical protein